MDLFLRIIATTRIYAPSHISLQVPPNLSPDITIFLNSGINDLGGISPLTIDWVNPEYGIYGVFTIESMALGKPVICTLTDSFYREYDLPVISVNPINLAKKITELYNNRESLIDIGKTSYDFVQSHHNPIASAKKVIERYKAVLD